MPGSSDIWKSREFSEESVFFHLIQIVEQLRNGEEVFVKADNGAHQYLYKKTSTKVVQQDQMGLYDTVQANIHLVALHAPAGLQ